MAKAKGSSNLLLAISIEKIDKPIIIQEKDLQLWTKFSKFLDPPSGFENGTFGLGIQHWPLLHCLTKRC